jgi:hypothetical protein
MLLEERLGVKAGVEISSVKQALETQSQARARFGACEARYQAGNLVPLFDGLVDELDGVEVWPGVGDADRHPQVHILVAKVQCACGSRTEGLVELKPHTFGADLFAAAESCQVTPGHPDGQIDRESWRAIIEFPHILLFGAVPWIM